MFIAAKSPLRMNDEDKDLCVRINIELNID